MYRESNNRKERRHVPSSGQQSSQLGYEVQQKLGSTSLFQLSAEPVCMHGPLNLSPCPVSRIKAVFQYRHNVIQRYSVFSGLLGSQRANREMLMWMLDWSSGHSLLTSLLKLNLDCLRCC
jgi:hypothetical protein